MPPEMMMSATETASEATATRPLELARDVYKRQVQGAPRGVTRAERLRDRCRREVRQRELFELYGLAPEVEQMYPHELSGGMARRVLLMCALMEEPRLLIADEPTPGLDVELSVRAVDDLRAFADTGAGVILITHDLELAVRVADRIAVFKDGRVVEELSLIHI